MSVFTTRDPERERDCEKHWAKIRANLPPFIFPPQPPFVRMECTEDRKDDLRRFLKMRDNALNEYREAMKRYEAAKEART